MDQKTEFSGFEIGSLAAEDLDACCAACKANPKCTFWTFNAAAAATKSCSLQNSDAGRRVNPATTSGSSVTPPSPTKAGPRIAALATTLSASDDAAREEGAGSKSTSSTAAVFLSYWSPPFRTDEPNRTVAVELTGGENFPRSYVAYRIDSSHANAQAAWNRMGSPGRPTPAQLELLMKASELNPTTAQSAKDIRIEMEPNAAVVLVFQ